MNYDYENVSVLIGKTLVSVEKSSDDGEILFTVDDGTKYKMHHDQDCCESVSVESIVGDVSDLIGSPILKAEEVTNRDNHPDGVTHEYAPDSFTWTFYKFATIKGYVDIRWYGESNGYYSEGVSFVRV